MTPRARRLLPALAAILLLSSGCPSATPAQSADIQGLRKRLEQPGLGLNDIGMLSNELGERYEEAGLFAEAATAYAQAVWAFETVQQLTGEEPVLLGDARENRDRVSETGEAGE